MKEQTGFILQQTICVYADVQIVILGFEWEVFPVPNVWMNDSRCLLLWPDQAAGWHWCLHFYRSWCGSYNYANAAALCKRTCWWDLMHIRMAPALKWIHVPYFLIPLSFSPSPLPLSGKCNVFLRRACLCCCDLHRPQELPVFARANRASVNGHVNQASVSHVERGGTAADL